MNRKYGDNVAVHVNGLGKRYVINGYDVARRSFREMLMDAIQAPINRYRNITGHVSEDKQFWALRNLSFDVHCGEVIGVIGRNGAGKSTLLKVLTGITPPTEGLARIRGRVSALLEVGTGFHPELTGRDNVFLNGAILGMSRREILAKFDEIVAFSEVGRFIDTPVKRYSSGMHVRLAFSIAAHLDPDVLLVDEVLAVGDKQFQSRSLGKLQGVANEGRTVVYVSHNMGSIIDLCDRCIVLDKGTVLYDGSTENAVRRYLETMADNVGELDAGLFRGPLAQQVVFHELRVNGKIDGNVFVSPSEELEIVCQGQSHLELSNFNIFISIFKDGVRLISLQDAPDGTTLQMGSFTSKLTLPPYFLRPGSYTIGIGGERKGQYEWLWANDVAAFTMLEQWQEGYEERNYGPINYSNYGQRIQ